MVKAVPSAKMAVKPWAATDPQRVSMMPARDARLRVRERSMEEIQVREKEVPVIGQSSGR
jgi:nuclear transport factor 2 (NTF2) superfamily protein